MACLERQLWQTEKTAHLLDGLRLLVVDNDPDSRDLVTFALENEGVEVQELSLQCKKL